MASLNSNVPPFDSSELKELKEKLVDGCHILDREGITDGYGHVSLRIPGADAFLTLAGVSPGSATLDRLVILDFDGRYLSGVKSPPYEWPIHACIFRARPDVMSVCHTHSKWSSLFSILKDGLRPTHMYARFLPPEGPPIYPRVGLIGTVERGEALAKVLKDSAAVLLRAHGDTIVGSSLEEAILRTIRLAFVAELAHMAVAHGEPLYLTEDEMAVFSADPSFPARPWEYYLSRARQRRSP
ncbi:MAG TPA: class II aldolase/adducin family protein [Candidatus Binatia bacterium]|nr:class II aldolase/adducin family protein [Candidatus Binatia bacterium]